MNRFSFTLFVLLAFVVLALGACAEKPPRADADAAEDAFLAAQLASKCADSKVEYASAEKALAQARTLMREKKYKDARLSYAVAKDRSLAAKKKAEESKACQEPAPQANGMPAGVPQSAENVSSLGLTPKDPNYELAPVYFLFNSEDLTEDARTQLEKNAEWMKNFPGTKVVLEGHCDKRGSTQFNLSLGERRAGAVRKFLSALQVNPDLLDLVSYGEEKPAQDEDSEEAYAKNRRVEFRKTR